MSEINYKKIQSIENISQWIMIVAVLIFIIEIFFLGASDSGSFGLLIVCVFFIARQINEDFQYGLVLFSVIMHLLLALSPALTFAHRGFNDQGFGQFLSVLNLVILIPWAINLTVIRNATGNIQKGAKVLGSFGNAFLAIIFAGIYALILSDGGASFNYLSTFEITGLSLKSGLLFVEFILFIRLMFLGE
jgi:hypothetical protein